MDKITTVSASSVEWDFIDDLSSSIDDENIIVEILLCRLGRQKIYTWVGPLLLALNPGRHLDDLYDETQRKVFALEETNHPKKATPHIYAVANRAQYRLANGLGKMNQVIVISGESGTGKTFNARKVFNFLAAKNDTMKSFVIEKHEAEFRRNIFHKIGNVIPLISAFSTARTSKNSRSSRHGQLLRLQYEKNGVIRGACIHSFLLERTRLTDCSNNFEIFYQLMYGLSDQAMSELLLSRNENYNILADCSARYNQCLADEFRQTVASLEALGFTEEWRSDIFRIIALLLHLGNIRFKKKSGEGCTIDLVNGESRNAFQKACSLISLPESDLTELLTTTLICPQSSRGRHTSYRRVLKTPEDCRNRLFGIARFIYDGLFKWLVERVNETISANDDNYHWLGILDIFGFESFRFNGLEQLCINYATERLQLYFMEDYLEAGRIEFEEEGLGKLPTSSTIQLYRDRLFAIEEIVFPIFNDASQSPITPELSALRKQLLTGGKKLSNFLDMKDDVFVIEHYSCSVEYNVNSLLSKNTDKVPSELSSALGKCNNQLLLLLIDADQENSRGTRVSTKKCTALAKLKLSLDSLVKELNKCDPHYVRCAKPRMSNGSWTKGELREQLRGTGIFDALPLARCKFPVKLQYEEFYKRYSLKQKSSNTDLLRDLRAILDSEDLGSSIHFGKRLVFFTEAIFFDLEKYRKNYRSRCAEKIQSFWMRARDRRRTRKFSNPTKKEFRDSTKYTDEECREFENYENASVSGNLVMETVKKSRVLSADTGYSSNMTIGDESQTPEIISRPSDISTCTSREEARKDSELLESEKISPLATIDIWKDFYVRNWLNFNPTDIKRTPKAELPKDRTLIVNLNEYPLFYRNRILSRRRPMEIPVKFHTRITCLTHSHYLPDSLRPHGLGDCLFGTINCVVKF